MKKIYLFVLASIICSTLSAQNLNPEVEVTNEYEARMSGLLKNGFDMTVPDSLRQFSTDIDYSVFATTYKGAYDFTPYQINVTPEAGGSNATRLYLRAGAGYSFHPVLKAAFAPAMDGNLKNADYLDFHGYGGKYGRADAGADYDGHDYNLGVGGNLRLHKEKFDIFGELGYNGIYTADDIVKSGFHDISLGGRIASNDPGLKMPYGFKTELAYAADRFSTPGWDPLGEFSYLIDGTVSPELAEVFDLAIDVHTQGSFYSRRFAPLLLSWLAPKAVFEWDALRLAAGVKVCIGGGFGLYPDVMANYRIAGGLVDVYAGVSGGRNAFDYSSIKTANHWVNPDYFPSDETASIDAMKVSVERINARIGFRGSVAGRFQYDVCGGWASYANAVMDALGVSQDISIAGKMYVPGIEYADYNAAYVKMDADWVSDNLDVSSDVLFRKSNITANDTYLGIPALQGTLSAIYNWNRRVFAGVRAKGQTGRPSTVWDDKGFLDLGLYGEYALMPELSVWLQAGNLLNSDIALSPTHIPGGDGLKMHFTGGICLRLR